MAEHNLISLSIRIAIPILQDIIDESALKIISSNIDIEKMCSNMLRKQIASQLHL